MRAVLDPNVLISSLLSPTGSPARVLRAWISGAYELVVSPHLLEELERALGYPKLGERITKAEASEFVKLLALRADKRVDPKAPPPVRSPDPDDDYLITLAAECNAVIVSGDGHLLGLGGDLPVYSPAAFLALVDPGDS